MWEGRGWTLIPSPLHSLCPCPLQGPSTGHIPPQCCPAGTLWATKPLGEHTCLSPICLLLSDVSGGRGGRGGCWQEPRWLCCMEAPHLLGELGSLNYSKPPEPSEDLNICCPGSEAQAQPSRLWTQHIDALWASVFPAVNWEDALWDPFLPQSHQ